MYRQGKITVLLFAVSLLLSQSGARAETRKASIRIPQTVLVGTSTLEPGDYSLQWVTHSPEATITLTRKGTAAVATQGRVEVREARYSRDMLIYRNSADGPPRLVEVRFAGKKEVLILE